MAGPPWEASTAQAPEEAEAAGEAARGRQGTEANAPVAQVQTIR